MWTCPTVAILVLCCLTESYNALATCNAARAFLAPTIKSWQDKRCRQSRQTMASNFLFAVSSLQAKRWTAGRAPAARSASESRTKMRRERAPLESPVTARCVVTPREAAFIAFCSCCSPFWPERRRDTQSFGCQLWQKCRGRRRNRRRPLCALQGRGIGRAHRTGKAAHPVHKDQNLKK